MTEAHRTDPLHSGPDATLIAALKAVVGDGGWLEDPADTAAYTNDWRKRWPGRTPVVLRPSSTAEVAEIVRLAGAAGVGVVPQSGNTGLVGGSGPRDTGEDTWYGPSRKASRSLSGTRWS